MKKPSVIKRTLIIVGSILAIGLAAIIFAVTYRGSTEPIEEVAAQLRVDPSWKLESEVVEPPRFICLGANSCPSLHKVWKVTKSISGEEFERLIKDSGLDLQIEKDCIASPLSIGETTVCSAMGIDSGYKIKVWTTGDRSDPTKTKFIININ